MLVVRNALAIEAAHQADRCCDTSFKLPPQGIRPEVTLDHDSDQNAGYGRQPNIQKQKNSKEQLPTNSNVWCN